MGAWGVLAFENDDANDWAYELEDSEDLSLIESAFAEVESATDYLEAPEASCALAACEVLARLIGKPRYTDAYTESVDRWVASHPQPVDTDLIARANSIIDRVLGPDSELSELWSDSDSADQWIAGVEDLRRQLSV